MVAGDFFFSFSLLYILLYLSFFSMKIPFLTQKRKEERNLESSLSKTKPRREKQTCIGDNLVGYIVSFSKKIDSTFNQTVNFYLLFFEENLVVLYNFCLFTVLIFILIFPCFLFLVNWWSYSQRIGGIGERVRYRRYFKL